MNAALSLPLLVPLLTSALTLLLIGAPRASRVVSLLGALAHLASGLYLLRRIAGHGIQTMALGDWRPPFGIAFAGDLFGAMMVSLAGVLLCLSLIAMRCEGIDTGKGAVVHPAFHILVMGLSGVFLTADVFNLYVWFEVVLVASFALAAVTQTQRALAGTAKYMLLNAIASVFLLAGVGLLYGSAGTLNLADLSRVLAGRDDWGADTLAVLFFVAFGIKAAVFPLFFWMPASYHHFPVSIGAFFAGIMSKVGIYAMVRLWLLIFAGHAFAENLLLVSAGLTMVLGVLGAIAQDNVRRLLSFHVISQIGYLLFALGMGTERALVGLVLFMLHIVMAKAALFYFTGPLAKLAGGVSLERMGGLFPERAGAASVFAVAAMALAGLPPLSGFWAKLAVLEAGLSGGHYTLTGVALIVSLLTLFSMNKIWNEAFAKPRKTVRSRVTPRRLEWMPAISLAAAVALYGLFMGPVTEFAREAAAQLNDTGAYVRAVMGGTG